MWKKVSRFREFLSKLRKFDPTKNAKIGQLWMFVPVKNTKRSHLRKFLSSKTLIYKHTQYVVCNPFPKFYSIFRTYLIAWIVWDIKVLRSLCMWKFYHSKIIALKKSRLRKFLPRKNTRIGHSRKFVYMKCIEIYHSQKFIPKKITFSFSVV